MALDGVCNILLAREDDIGACKALETLKNELSSAGEASVDFHGIAVSSVTQSYDDWIIKFANKEIKLIKYIHAKTPAYAPGFVDYTPYCPGMNWSGGMIKSEANLVTLMKQIIAD